ncbi:MAG: hypothetical protein L0Y44_06925 [Phycisphaerales bacterium]|nr:hypothetical protein [Phycisphaerales bacterium]MCI0630373.1 hypothetical protein [Phycisphaerales bacterium]MCI0676641.1 hypothetical protein [Phycisphaerales bacterium]
MSTRSARRLQKRKHPPKPKPPRRTTDRAIYLGFLIVGIFVVILAWLFTSDSRIEYWRHVAVGYLIAVAYLINFYTLRTYQAKHLENWKQALARIPLRFAGYGTKDGKPLDAAHGHREALMALLISIAVSIALLGLISFLLLRDAVI